MLKNIICIQLKLIKEISVIKLAYIYKILQS